KEMDLSGWSFTSGPKFTFPDNCKIPAHGLLVVCRDLAAFRKAYIGDFSVLGNFTGKLNHKGEKIELVDQSKKVVESFKYSDHQPWPMVPTVIAVLWSASPLKLPPRIHSVGPRP